MQYKNPYIEICLEGASSVFKGLNQKEKEMLDQHHIIMLISRKADTIISEGDKTTGTDLSCYREKLKVFKEGAGNREQIIKMLRPQEFHRLQVAFFRNSFPIFMQLLLKILQLLFSKSNSLSRILKKNADLAVKFMKVIIGRSSLFKQQDCITYSETCQGTYC